MSGRRDHHALAGHEVLLLLETDPDRGLTAAEAAARLERYGPNVLPETRGGGVWSRVRGQFENPLVIVLVIAGAVTLVLGEYVDAAVIVGVVAVNALVGYVQETRAAAELDALRRLVRTHALVRRDGGTLTVPSEEVVPGDLVLVAAGDKLPADLRLLSSAELRTDESALTGESVPVEKDESALSPDTVVADRRNMLYSGTLVTSGTGTGLAVATGADTELGRIHELLGSVDPLATPLTRKLARFSRVLTVVILALAAVTFAVGVLRGESWPAMFNAAVALAVGAIPEGLPAAVSITLAIGVSRMARRRAVIRRLPAVETLGSTTVICTDKTGTLTENRMTVRRIWTGEREYVLSGARYEVAAATVAAQGSPSVRVSPAARVSPASRGAPAAPAGVGTGGGPDGDRALEWTLRIGALCTDAGEPRWDGPDGRADAAATSSPAAAAGAGAGGWTADGDPTEAALVVAAHVGGVDVAALRSAWPRTDCLPFSSSRRCMATRHDAAGRPVVLVKGAAERVVPRCRAVLRADGSEAPLDGQAALARAAALSDDGLRVLATAYRPTAPTDVLRDEDLDDLVLTGLQAMQDPPRAAAARAVAACHRAGIEVRLITGDHAGTAAAVAREVGIGAGAEPRVITGSELTRLPHAALADRVAVTDVFARVSPEQKLLLVDALQSRGHVVAMTGDGVNDAPALRQADIGVAMGRSGTEVAKDAADMVLTDDDFATIEAAVEEGRGVFDNLTKFIVWTLPTNMGEGLVLVVAILLGAALPILPSQILWINMTTAVALGLMLAFEPKEPGIMTRRPRDPAAPLLTRALVVRILLVSALLVAGAWWLFAWEYGSGASLAAARTAAVNLFVAVEIAYLFTCRTLQAPVRRVGLLSNRWIVGGVTVQVVGQLALTYLPVMHLLFDTAPIDAAAWGRIALVALAAWAVVWLDKRLRGSVL